MTEQHVTTKAELLTEIDDNWKALRAALDGLTESQLTTIKDAQGWTVKDHLSHLAAWERSAVFFLEGKPRHEGLGVDEATYLTGNEDTINAVIQARQAARSLAEVLAHLQDVHQDLLRLLEPITDTDLQQRYRHYLPDEPGEGDGPLAIDVVYGNSAHHFAGHRRWIEALLKV
jgi:hypothetical protein